jgi:hypothetical protein
MIDVLCEADEFLYVFNEDRSFMIFDYCLNQKNDTKLGNFVIARAKYLLIRMQTSSDRMLTSTFDFYLLDDPNLAVIFIF